jgi:hypothetical protein
LIAHSVPVGVELQSLFHEVDGLAHGFQLVDRALVLDESRNLLRLFAQRAVVLLEPLPV